MDNPQKEDNAVCPYCGNELEIATAEIAGLNVCIAWGRCSECGMSSGSKSGATKQEAKRNVLTYLHFPFEKDFPKRRMTIEELKRALVEVRDICEASWIDCVERCPLFDHKEFQCPIHNRFPSNWEVDDWKEDANETGGKSNVP